MKLWIAQIFFLLMSSSAFGISYVEIDKDVPKKTYKNSKKKMGLTKREKEQIEELLTWKSEKLRSHLEMSPSPLLVEVLDAKERFKGKHKPIEKARVIATYHIYEMVRKNWSALKNSVLNNNAVKTWDQFEPSFLRSLHKLEYGGFYNKHYLFDYPWGQVLVSVDHKKISYKFEISYHLDDNKLAKGARFIKIPDEDGSSYQ